MGRRWRRFASFGNGVGWARGGAALVRQFGDASQIAADAETPVAAEFPGTVENRQAGQLDRQPLGAVVDRPSHREPAPGLAGGERLRNPALRIEGELGGDVLPRLPQHGGRSRPDRER